MVETGARGVVGEVWRVGSGRAEQGSKPLEGLWGEGRWIRVSGEWGEAMCSEADQGVCGVCPG